MHEKVVHTDSAPSIIATENFTYDTQEKSANGISSIKPIIFKTNFLRQPFDCFQAAAQATKNSKNSIKIQKKEMKLLSIDRDNDELARFIEDNFNYFKKQSAHNNSQLQNNGDGCDDDDQSRSKATALSDSEFLTYFNYSDLVDDKNQKNSKNKMACSDSDFIINNNKKSRLKCPITFGKTKVPFARSFLLNGKRKQQQQQQANTPNTSANNNQKEHKLKNQLSFMAKNRSSTTSIFKKHKLFSALSKSYNESFMKKQMTRDQSSAAPLQRVFSDGNYNNNNERSSADELSSQDHSSAVDMFIKLLDYKKSDGIINEDDNLNCEVIVNRNEVTCCDPIVLNVTNSNCLKIHSLCDFSTLHRTPSNRFFSSKSSEQLIFVNQCVRDDSSNFNVNTMMLNNQPLVDDDLMINVEHVLANKFVVTTSPPPIQSLPPVCTTANTTATDSDKRLSSLSKITNSDYLNMMPTNVLLFSDASTLSSDGNAITPLLFNPSNDPDIVIESQLPAVSAIAEGADKYNSQRNLSDLTTSTTATKSRPINNTTTAIIKKDHSGSGSGSGGGGSGPGRNRQSSVVTYDINVINNCDESNTDGANGNRNCTSTAAAIAARRSTSSTSKTDFIPFFFSLVKDLV